MAPPGPGQPLVASGFLNGRRVLVVEDNFLIAMDVGDVLTDAGAEVLGPVSGVVEGLCLLAAQTGRIDAALLDVNLHREMVWPLADALLSRNVPVVFCTAYNAGKMPRAYAHLPCCEKPTAARTLVKALSGVVRRLDNERSLLVGGSSQSEV